MKTKFFLTGVIFLVFISFTGYATLRCCPPTNLAVTQSGSNPVRLTFSWGHSFPPPLCASITGFEIKVHVQGMGANSNIELYAIDGVEPISVNLDVMPGASVTWKVRSVHGGLNGLYHNGRYGEGILPSSWVDGPDIGNAGRLESLKSEFDAVNIYPNPVNNENITVEVNSEKSGLATFEIMDYIGKAVMEQENFLKAGLNSNRLDVAELQKGIYILRILHSDRISTMKFIKAN